MYLAQQYQCPSAAQVAATRRRQLLQRRTGMLQGLPSAHRLSRRRMSPCLVLVACRPLHRLPRRCYGLRCTFHTLTLILRAAASPPRPLRACKD